MAIINRPDAEKPQEEAPPPQGIVPKSAVRSSALPPAISTNTSTGIGRSLKVITVILVLGILGAGGWFLSEQDLSIPTARYDAGIVSLDIERAFRTRGLMDLLERRIAQNTDALVRANKNKDTLIADTLRLALAQNLDDLDRHQDAYIDTVVSLSKAYESDADKLLDALKATLSAAAGEYKIGQADTVTEVIKLLQKAPPGKPIRSYLTAQLKPQLQTQQ